VAVSSQYGLPALILQLKTERSASGRPQRGPQPHPRMGAALPEQILAALGLYGASRQTKQRHAPTCPVGSRSDSFGVRCTHCATESNGKIGAGASLTKFIMVFKKQQFGRTKEEFESKLLDLARVTRVTGGGKRLRFRAVVVVGDRKGSIGLGIDKGKDVSQAVEKATRRAKKNLITIAIKENTIPYEVQTKLGPAEILLKPQRKGRGLVAGGAVRTICDLAGIKDISSKILSRSKNKLNNARATIEALKKLKQT